MAEFLFADAAVEEKEMTVNEDKDLSSVTDESPRPALLPCPFCGASVQATEIKGAVYSLVSCRTVQCPASEFACYPEQWNTRVSPWQSTETAPKDKTRVLIFISSDDDGECHKIAYWSGLAARPGWFYRGGWCEESEPDGWMPLPDPPKEATA